MRAAYNDSAGITAAFNLNLLARMNRELGADFDLSAFEHRALYNRERQRIEMHLKSRKRQRVLLNGAAFEFERNETIHTENSYKYTPEGFASLARQAGWLERALWTDKNGYFSVRLLSVEARYLEPSADLVEKEAKTGYPEGAMRDLERVSPFGKPSAFADAEHEAIFRAATVEQLVAGFAQQIRYIDRGKRVGAFDHELVSRPKTGERLARLERGERGISARRGRDWSPPCASL